MGFDNFWCFVFQKGANVITDMAAYILLTVYEGVTNRHAIESMHVYTAY